MAVLRRAEVIRLLQGGEAMIESQWSGYSYTIGKFTVRFDTARYLIINRLVEKDESKGAPLLTYFKWSQYRKDIAGICRSGLSTRRDRGITDDNMGDSIYTNK